MHKILFVLILCSLSVTAFSQPRQYKNTTRPDSVGYYMSDDKTMAYNESSAKFVRLLIKTDSNMLRVNDYYMDGTPRLVAKTTVDSINFFPGARGICYEYYPNGKRKSIRNFNKGVVIGDMVNYYSNGGLHTIENYSKQGIYLKQCLDTVGNVLTDNGNGKWIRVNEDNLNDRMTGSVINGKEDGPWKLYVADTTYTIVYKQGEIISGKEFLKIKESVFGKVDVSPSFPGGEAKFFNFIAQNVKYPEMGRENNVQGKVILTFIIEKDGTITDIKVVRGIGRSFEQEAIRVISKSPKWMPGLINGRPVRVQYSVPINFSIKREQ
ncbi:MAG: TonB family protein [Bacteroidota bacterium]